MPRTSWNNLIIVLLFLSHCLCYCEIGGSAKKKWKVRSHLKFCMNCLNLSVRRDSGTTMLMGMLDVSTLSFFTFISGPKGRNRTKRLNSLLDSPLKVSSYSVPLSLSVRVIPDWWDKETWSQDLKKPMSTFNGTVGQICSFLTKVIWKDWHQSKICPLNIKLQQGDNIFSLA